MSRNNAFLICRTLELPEVPDIANDPKPNFAQLVYRYLPNDEWDKCYTRARFTSSGRLISGPESSIIDAYHYELLLKVLDCDKMKLEHAWTEWQRLGEYKHGEDQRKDLFFTSRDKVEHWQFQQTLKEGLAGTRGARRAFEAKWTSIALEQMEEDPDWEMWEEIEEFREPPIEPTRRVGSVRDADYFNRLNPEEVLGPRCYYAPQN